MSTVVKNIGAIDPGPENQQNTDQKASHAEIGTVRVTLRGVEWVWGPNESKTVPDDIAAEAVAASGSRLRIADTRDGAATALRS